MSSFTQTDIWLLSKRFNDLTREEFSYVDRKGWVNGCGPKWFTKFGITPPKDIFFDADCGHHDWGYLGGYCIRGWWRIDDIICAIIRKLECDCKFYWNMLKDIFRLPDLKKRLYFFARATIYFSLVVTCGWFSFNWSGVYNYY